MPSSGQGTPNCPPHPSLATPPPLPGTPSTLESETTFKVPRSSCSSSSSASVLGGAPSLGGPSPRGGALTGLEEISVSSQLSLIRSRVTGTPTTRKGRSNGRCSGTLAVQTREGLQKKKKWDRRSRVPQKMLPQSADTPTHLRPLFPLPNRLFGHPTPVPTPAVSPPPADVPVSAPLMGSNPVYSAPILRLCPLRAAVQPPV